MTGAAITQGHAPTRHGKSTIDLDRKVHPGGNAGSGLLWRRRAAGPGPEVQRNGAITRAKFIS
jgi:hypothetical protein